VWVRVCLGVGGGVGVGVGVGVYLFVGECVCVDVCVCVGIPLHIIMTQFEGIRSFGTGRVLCMGVCV